MIARERVLPLATEKFGDRIRASEWLRTPNRALDEKAPLELLNSDSGLRRIRIALDRVANRS